MSKLLKDSSGIYNLDQVASLHPINIRGDKTDQNRITGVNTAISTVGGQTHQTEIPWAAASAIALDYWKAGAPAIAAGGAPTAPAPAKPVSPPPVAPPAPTADQLAADEATFSA
jgi:hypothetical protein